MLKNYFSLPRPSRLVPIVKGEELKKLVDTIEQDMREQDMREQDMREQDMREQDMREQDMREKALSIKLVVSLQIDVIIGTEIFPYYVVQKLLNNSKISNKITLLEIRKVEEGYLVTVLKDGSLILVSSLQDAVDLGLK